MSINVERVASFKASDGTLHANRKAALEREFTIQLRAIIQSNTAQGVLSLSATDTANLIRRNAKNFSDTIRKFSESLRREETKIANGISKENA